MFAVASFTALTFAQATQYPVEVVGVQGTAAVNGITVVIDNTVSLTGLSATGLVGSVVVTGDATTSVTGLSGTSAIGDVVASISTEELSASFRMVSSVGVVSAIPEINVFVDGVSANAFVGTAATQIWAEIAPSTPGNWTEIAA